MAAAGWHPWASHRRAERNEWANLAVASGVVGLIGVATHNPTVAAVGLGGAIYGGIRYDDEVRPYGYRYGHGWDDRRWRDHRGYHRRY